ncbi:MAG: hypothetical protein VYE46_09005 [Cyanobacteriota bacterium]|nr:hypothetical protein [Cyanobacteriota bacterium]
MAGLANEERQPVVVGNASKGYLRRTRPGTSNTHAWASTSHWLGMGCRTSRSRRCGAMDLAASSALPVASRRAPPASGSLRSSCPARSSAVPSLSRWL